MSVVPKTLRFRVVMMLLIAFLLSAGAFILAMNTVVTTSFQQIETDDVLRDVARVHHAVDEQVEEVAEVGALLASPEGASTLASLSPQALSELGVDFAMADAGGSGAVRPALYVSAPSSAETSAATALALERFSAMQAVDTGGESSGLLLLPGGPAAVSVRRAAATAGHPAQRVVVGRFLTAATAASVGKVVQSEVVFADPAHRATLPIPPVAYSATTSGAAGVVALNARTNLGWSTLLGQNGAPALVYAVVDPRPIMVEASKTLAYTQWGVSLLSLLVGLSIVVMLEGSVLNRLVKLRESVIDYADDSSSLTPVTAHGSDEISDLAVALNTTLGKIKASEQAHKHDARHDHLTGLANRRCLQENADRVLARCAEDGTKCTLVLLDLDGFKRINDELGHQVGDDVLAWFANHMRESLRRDSTMCRLGGDEFAVLMPNTDHDDAAAAVERLRIATSQPEDNPCFGMHDVQFSVGYAVYPDHGETLEMLSQCGDTDLYANKRGKAEARAEQPADD